MAPWALAQASEFTTPLVRKRTRPGKGPPRPRGPSYGSRGTWLIMGSEREGLARDAHLASSLGARAPRQPYPKCSTRLPRRRACAGGESRPRVQALAAPARDPVTNEQTTNRRSERRPGAAAAAAAAARACPRLPGGWIEPMRASPCGRSGCAALVRRSAAEANTRSVRSRARPARHRERVRGHMEASGGRASSLRTRSGPWRQRSREMRLIRNDLPRAPHNRSRCASVHADALCTRRGRPAGVSTAAPGRRLGWNEWAKH